MNAPVIDLEPVEIEQEIAEIVTDRLPAFRDREAKQEAAWHAFTAAWERRFGKPYPFPVFFSLAFAGILAVAWVAEQTLSGAL